MNKLQKFMGEVSEAAAKAEVGDESAALVKAKAAYEAYRARMLASVSAQDDRADRAQTALYDLEGALSVQAETFGARGRRLAQALGDSVRRDARSPHELFQDEAATIAPEDLNASNDE